MQNRINTLFDKIIDRLEKDDKANIENDQKELKNLINNANATVVKTFLIHELDVFHEINSMTCKKVIPYLVSGATLGAGLAVTAYTINPSLLTILALSRAGFFSGICAFGLYNMFCKKKEPAKSNLEIFIDHIVDTAYARLAQLNPSQPRKSFK